MQVSILSERRSRTPFGLQGGGAGLRGENRLNNRPLPGKATFAVQPGDVLRIATPGAGRLRKTQRMAAATANPGDDGR